VVWRCAFNPFSLSHPWLWLGSECIAQFQSDNNYCCIRNQNWFSSSSLPVNGTTCDLHILTVRRWHRAQTKLFPPHLANTLTTFSLPSSSSLKSRDSRTCKAGRSEMQKTPKQTSNESRCAHVGREICAIRTDDSSDCGWRGETFPFVSSIAIVATVSTARVPSCSLPSASTNP
jgi:hypothetical protein